MNQTEERVRKAMQGYAQVPIGAGDETAVLRRARLIRRRRRVAGSLSVVVLIAAGVGVLSFAAGGGTKRISPAEPAVTGSPYYLAGDGAKLVRAAEGRLTTDGPTFAQVWQPAGAAPGATALRVVVLGGEATVAEPNRQIRGLPAHLLDSGDGVLDLHWAVGDSFVTLTSRGLDEAQLLAVAVSVEVVATGGPATLTAPVGWVKVAEGPATPETVAVDEEFRYDGGTVRLLAHADGAMELHWMALLPGAEAVTLEGHPAVLVTYSDQKELDLVWLDDAGVVVRLQGTDKAAMARLAGALKPVSRDAWLRSATDAGVVPSIADGGPPVTLRAPAELPEVLRSASGLPAPDDELVLAGGLVYDGLCVRVTLGRRASQLESCGPRPASTAQMQLVGAAGSTVEGAPEEASTVAVVSVPPATASLQVVGKDGGRRPLPFASVPGGSNLQLAAMVVLAGDSMLEARDAVGDAVATMSLAAFAEAPPGG